MKWIGLFRGGWGMARLLCIFFLCSFGTSAQAADLPDFSSGNITYCSLPPVPGAGFKSNLLILLDNSASMADLAYMHRPSRICNKDAKNPGTPCNVDAECTRGVCEFSAVPAYCYDQSYDDSTTYAGYFVPGSTYHYDLPTERFIAGGTLPPNCGGNPSCVASTDFFHLEMTGTRPANGEASSRTVSVFIAKGNFLNWLSTSKLDLEKQALTGGKFQADSSGAGGVLVGETRGCYGKKMIKAVGKAKQITFAVAGDIPPPDSSTYLYENKPSSGGETSIEIFDKQYEDACNTMVDDWLSRTQNTTFIDHAFKCIGNDNAAINRLIIDKNQAIYTLAGLYIYGRAQCGGLTAMSDTGTRQQCTWHQTYFPGDGLPVRYRGDDVCIPSTVQQHCDGLSDPEIPDRSGTVADMYAGIPSFIHDLGVYSLCGLKGSNKSFSDEECHVAGKLRVRIKVDSPPAGLIQEFGDDFNLGIMTFNRPGGLAAPLGSSPGEHPSSASPPSPPAVIPVVDQMNATASTPLAEAFYNSIGYFTGSSDLWPKPSDFDNSRPKINCQKNNILIVTDGVSTADRNSDVYRLVTNALSRWGSGADKMPTSKMTAPTATSPALSGSYNLDDLAWVARHKNIANSSNGLAYANDYVSTYVIYSGEPCAATDANGLCTTPDETVAQKFMQMAALNGGGKITRVPLGGDFYSAIRALIQEISAGSGTDSYVFSTGDGNGGIFLQERFYPTRSFDNGQTSASWTGEMQSLWYYIDPFIGSTAGLASTIRQDDGQNGVLSLTKDKIVALRYDPAAKNTVADLRADSNGDGLADGAPTTVGLDALLTIWRAGEQLWKRDLTSKARTIYTPLLPNGEEAKGGGQSGMMYFSSLESDSTNLRAIAPYLHLQGRDPEAYRVIRYIEGFDVSGDLPDDPSGLVRLRRRTLAKGGIPGSAGEPRTTGKGVWKLGDIISSTPQVQSRVPLGAYHLSPPRGYGDLTYANFIGSPAYRGRGMVYVGANDGMLHAFTFGDLDSSASDDVRATLSGSGIGDEEWAFIPTNALPYLKYLANPRYRHMYYVDGKVTLVDASIGDPASGSAELYSEAPKTAASWRTILIGGMGLGGATCGAGGDCVQLPGNGLGYSSYFALDVTDPKNPRFLWEFGSAALGYSTTGPAIVRIGKPELNGRWFAVFGSGPTGPIDTANSRFLGGSRQELQFFVVDLRTGELKATLSYQGNPRISNAFAGSMSGAGIDADRWDPGSWSTSYQDDALYAGYSQLNAGSWDGGVVRIMTNANADPKQWTVSKVIEGVGPVTGGITRLQDRKNKNLWLYFGSGRYFFNLDDFSTPRGLYGIKEPCYNVKAGEAITKPNVLDPACTLSLRSTDVTEAKPDAVTATEHGWSMGLLPAGNSMGAERLLATPVAATSGSVFFSTYQPNSDICVEGDSYLIGVRYDSGGAISDPTLKGKALVQLSTGEVADKAIGKSTGADPRRSDKMTGMPGGLKVVSNSGLRPARRILHIQER